MSQQIPPNFADFGSTIQYIVRQLERLDERTQNLVTRSDLENLRKELVARDSLEPQLTTLKSQITRVDTDRIEDRDEANKRLDKIEAEQISRQDRLWMRLTQVVGIAGFVIAMFELLAHLKFIP